MLTMYSNESFEIGENVFVIYCDEVRPALITGKTVDPADAKCAEHLDLKLGAPIYGSVTVRAHNAFHDELTARSALYARNYQRFMDYKAEIKTLDDLLTFSLTHILAGEEMDELARQAYTARAKELGHPLFQPDTIDPDLLLHAIGRL